MFTYSRSFWKYVNLSSRKSSEKSSLNHLAYATTERRIGRKSEEGRTVEGALFKNLLFVILYVTHNAWPSSRRIRYTGRGFIDLSNIRRLSLRWLPSTMRTKIIPCSVSSSLGTGRVNIRELASPSSATSSG